MVKVYLQNQAMSELDSKIAMYGGQERTYETKVLDYKKKIDDYGAVINNHQISSNVFSFIEERTLSNVWFSSFNMSQTTDELKVSGEAENMEIFSRQIQVFERSQDYVKRIDVLDSQVEAPGKIKFILSLSLHPNIFAYVETSLPPSVNE